MNRLLWCFVVVVVVFSCYSGSGVMATTGCCMKAQKFSTNMTAVAGGYNSSDMPYEFMNEFLYFNEGSEMYTEYQMMDNHQWMSGAMWQWKAANGSWYMTIIYSSKCYVYASSPPSFDQFCATPPFQFMGDIQVLGVDAQLWLNVTEDGDMEYFTVRASDCMPAQALTFNPVKDTRDMITFFNQKVNGEATPPPPRPTDCIVGGVMGDIPRKHQSRKTMGFHMMQRMSR